MNVNIIKNILNEQFDLKIIHMTQLTDHNISATYYLNTSKGSYQKNELEPHYPVIS